MNSEPLFNEYKCKEDYEKDNLRYIEPMLAKELPFESWGEYFKNSNYIVEEKLDGTRATIHFTDRGVRIFSRRVSKKTGWFCENSDSLPHIRDMKFPRELVGSVLDCEMFIPNQAFKEVSSTLNCLYDKAIKRQEELGKIVCNVFDILQFSKFNLEKAPLKVRKKLLSFTIKALNSDYIVEVPYLRCNTLDVYDYFRNIVDRGGEGLILKPLDLPYRQGMRGKEYLKIKKILSKDCIIIRFSEPTKDYEGKFPVPEKWQYWETNEGDIFDTSKEEQLKTLKKYFYPDMCIPVSKYYFENWVGNIVFGVIIDDEDYDYLYKLKQETKKSFNLYREGTVLPKNTVLEIGECGGFDEEMREYLTKNKSKLVGSVVEVKANEIFKDTGRLRHPRFMRLRPDKNAEECTFKTHLI